VIITSGIVRAADGPPRRAMVSATKPSVSAIILLCQCSERVIITSGIVRAVDGPPRRAMVSVTMPSVSTIILLCQE
jgi:hypothetical protein